MKALGFFILLLALSLPVACSDSAGGTTGHDAGDGDGGGEADGGGPDVDAGEGCNEVS